METEAALSAFAALSQGTRLDVFRLLIRHEPDGLAAGELARLLSVAPNTLTAHLTVLAYAHLVMSQRRSRSIYCVRTRQIENSLAVFATELLQRAS